MLHLIWRHVSVACLAFVCCQPLLAQSPLAKVEVASGLTRPLYVTAPNADFNRLFIVEKTWPLESASASGLLRLLDISQSPPVLLATPYLTISPIYSMYEGGLLGLAFHPQFATNGYFFVYYSVNGGTTVRVVRYQATAPYMTSTTANAASATQVMEFAHPSSYHYGGWMGFGPDGFLYISTGEAGYPAYAQDLAQLLGKMLRIDVDSDDFPSDPMKNYAIPPSNPFNGSATALPEIWHYGLRNPWRASFDRLTGDMWIGDVGQAAFEEVDFVPAGASGRNFGWGCMEGLNCTGNTDCVCNDPSLTLPVHAYSHTSGVYCVIGGYRYRGTALCGFQGTYFFGDLSHRFWTLQWDGSSIQNLTDRSSELGLPTGSYGSFGEDAAGEIYVVKLGLNAASANGKVFKLVPGTITDCNQNGVHDGCDIAGGGSSDLNSNAVPDECEALGTPSCFGDGSTATACPCANTGALGHGCQNSATTGGARLEAAGAPAHDDVVLTSTGELPSVLTIFLQGNLLNVNGLVFGDGVRCVAGALKRLYVKPASGGFAYAPHALDLSITARSAQLGDPLLPLSGQVRYYQAYYRDPSAAFCAAPAGSTWNISSLIAITW